MLRLYSLIFLLLSPLHAEVRTLWQTLDDYHTIVPPENSGRQDRHKVNPFLSYTNIGTDFGFIGPAEKDLGWQSGQISLNLGQEANDWVGMWHSLARLARMPDTMNFAACYPAAILPAYQPHIDGLRAIIRGKGTWKVEIKDAQNQLLWSETRVLDHKDFTEVIYSLPYEKITTAKTLTWIAEPGADFDIDRIDMRVITPDVSFDKWIFLASYAKALTCWSPAVGLARDRAHTADGSFDSVASTGLFCLSTAAAADLGIVSKDFANQVMDQAYRAVAPLRGPYQLLPHFIRLNDDGKLERHPGTEYSTIDTSLFYLSLMIGSKMLGNEERLQQLLDDSSKLDFTSLMDENGYISHGVKEDEKTIIPFYWKDWGGETALVMIVQQMINPSHKASMAKTGRPHQGIGFIAELQSLLFPDFDTDLDDAVTGSNWRAVRKKLLSEQKDYMRKHQASSNAAKDGLYGLSAGEQLHGKGYSVSGVDFADQFLLHPHYILMAAATEDEPENVRQVVRLMETQHIFTPWGMVENVDVIHTETLAMIGSLNACFETLGAYHFLKKADGSINAIHQAAHAIPQMNHALKLFYP